MHPQDGDIAAATRSYEAWVSSHIDLVPPDLRLKHARMRESPFVFLRGTFYRWIQQWPMVCHSIAQAPEVMAVGDLHLENFGTWRDREARLVWGVNDLDEAARLPYTQDLVRLATSAWLATRSGELAISLRVIANEIVNGYLASLEAGGRPFVLAEQHRWLRRAAWGDSRAPMAFWQRLKRLRQRAANPPRAVIERAMPDHVEYRVFHRVVGVGSLGRPRFVALATWQGSLIAREVKARVPSAALWAGMRGTGANACEYLLRRSVRALDPYFQVTRFWVVRRLSPDCSKVELGDLARKRDERRLLRAMGWETANLHLAGGPSAGLRRHLRSLPESWLRTAAADMSDVTMDDWRDWTKAGGASKRRPVRRKASAPNDRV
jgi:hypothetical protein